ncbi:hypothetical protein B0H12DRAFT_1138627 [Mycena haematopus]|nr:hypothetical protein B0H12DRAFT_1138627 [Mycena haematopus]
MASVSDLPQELVDKIISEFEDDEANLRVCALISRVFVPCSQHHLFSSVRLTRSNLYAFRTLVESSPAIAAYVRRVDLPMMPSFRSPMAAILPPATLACLPNITHLYTRSDAFDFRHLSPTNEFLLADTLRRLTTIEIILDRLWPLPAWASLLNGCSSLTTLVVNADAWDTWMDADVVFPMPAPPVSGTLRLHTLRVSGDSTIVVPLTEWLVPQDALTALHTLGLNITYSAYDGDFTASDVRVPLVLAAASSLCELTLNLNPTLSLAPFATHSAPLTIASLPRLRSLHLHDDTANANLETSLAWLAAFLTCPSLSDSACPQGSMFTASLLEKLSFDHHMFSAELLAVPTAVWCAIEDALLGDGAVESVIVNAAPHPHLRVVAVSDFKSFGIPFARFAKTVRERLPRLQGRGMLELGCVLKLRYSTPMLNGN